MPQYGLTVLEIIISIELSAVAVSFIGAAIIKFHCYNTRRKVCLNS